MGTSMGRVFSLLFGIIIIFLVLYAQVLPGYQIYSGIFLCALYVAAGLFRQNSPSHQFTRFCMGESAAIALWFVSSFFGVMIALLVTAEFLNGFTILKNRNGCILFALWGVVMCILAFLSEEIQHTLLLCMAVLVLAGLVALTLLLFEYRMVYQAGRDEL